MGEMIGRCPECGEHYYGWALRNPDDQGCEICGCELEIYNYKDAARELPFSDQVRIADGGLAMWDQERNRWDKLKVEASPGFAIKRN